MQASEVPDSHKIAVYEALRRHFEGALDRYFTEDIHPDPRYDTGVAAETTECIGLEVHDGWLLIEMQIKGWADVQEFTIELPELMRDAHAGDGWLDLMT